MGQLMHRTLRLAAFLSGLLVGGATVVFAYSNQGRLSLSWWRLHQAGVPLWLVAVVPLVAGVAAGYLYHLPARMHHFHEHMRHRHLVHAQAHEIKQLKHSLDQLLAAPAEEVPARVAIEPPAVVRLADAPGPARRRPRGNDSRDLAAASE